MKHEHTYSTVATV